MQCVNLAKELFKHVQEVTFVCCACFRVYCALLIQANSGFKLYYQ